MHCDLTHARHDPAHCLCPGLARSIGPGGRALEKLDVTYQYGDRQIRFWGPEVLGPTDVKVLLGLVAMAAVGGEQHRGIILSSEPQSEAGRQLRLRLGLSGVGEMDDAMVVRGDYRYLAKQLGMKGGSFRELIRDSIRRLFAVSVFETWKERGKVKERGYHVLAKYESDEIEEKIFVALNPRVTDAVLGVAPHTRISLADVRALAHGWSLLIYVRLCGWVDPGCERRVEIDTLCGYAWPDASYLLPLTQDADDIAKNQRKNLQKEHRKKVRGTLSELVALGWGVKVVGKGKKLYALQRPQLEKVIEGTIVAVGGGETEEAPEVPRGEAPTQETQTKRGPGRPRKTSTQPKIEK